MPLVSCSQNKLDKVVTESMYADQGDYNKTNSHILFVAISEDSIMSSFEVSLKIKNTKTRKETIIIPNLYHRIPEFGWLDSSHVFYETIEPIGTQKVFGPWQGYIIKHNIFTHKKDTIPSFWYSSKNHVGNFYASESKLFYTISHKGKNGREWIEYSLKTKKNRLVKNLSDNENFNLLTYNYISKTDEIFYINGNENRREFIRLSLSSGEENIVKVINTNNSIESSTINGDLFYYLEREISLDKHGLPDLKNSNFVIKSMNIYSGKVKLIYLFEKGLEVSKITEYDNKNLLVSIQGEIDGLRAEKVLNLVSGGDITLEINPTSSLYILEL